MAQNVPELQLLTHLKDKFPEVTHFTIMKYMKMFNNDADKCIQALEQESQKSMFGPGPPQPSDHNSHQANHNNSANHTSYAQANSGNKNNNQSVMSSFPASSSASIGLSRYQELPVRHEPSSSMGMHHISTVRHTITQPSAQSKPDAVFSRPPMLPLQTRTDFRPVLVIDPANQMNIPPNTAPVKPQDFDPFLEPAMRPRTEIPNIRCGPTSFGGEGGASGVSAMGGSPEQRRPVRVINVQGHTSGGTVTSRAVTSPSGISHGPQFRVVLGDGGGVCLPSSASSGPSSSNSSSGFASSPYASSAQETERPGVHSSSIFIDSTVSSRRTNVQESSGESSSINPNIYGGGGVHMMEPQGPTSMPVSRTLPPLSVSLSSQVSNIGPESRIQSAVSYNQYYPSGAMSMAGGRYAQDVSRSPPRNYPVSSMMNNLALSPNPPGGVSSMYPGYPAPSAAGVSLAQPMGYHPMSPAVMHRSPSLQHQRSTGSSTSRSNSMDSEHGSVHLTGSDYDQHTPPLPPHQMTPPVHRVGVVMPMAVPVLSPSSSQSSLSSESSTRERDHGNAQRPRSGSMQEEAAYSQALLEHQRQRMLKLTEDIHEKRQFLEQLRHEVLNMEKPEIGKNSARTTFPTPDDIAGLCENNRQLQTDIQMFLNEIDMYKNGQIPFTNIDPLDQQSFYKNMPTGPNDLQYNKPADRPRASPPPPPVPPPRPPPPRPPVRINSNDISQPVPAPNPHQITQGGGSGDSEEGESWSCSACTFRNHPALKKCEMCEMPRLMAGRESLGMVGSISMPQLHQLGGVHPHHRGAGGQVCYCHNRLCQQKLHKL